MESESEINNFVAAQRERAAQVLSLYNNNGPPRERERDRERDRDRERRRDRFRDDDRDHGDIDERVRSRDRHERDRSGERSSRRSYGDERSYGSRYDNSSSSSGTTIDYNHGRSSKDSRGDSGDEQQPRSRSDRDDRASDKWMTDTPTNTILLRGLPTSIDEQDIKAELMMFGAPIKDVRLMKRKDTGASRGFAFVEFQNVTDSQRWMEQNQGQVTILNQYTISMFYSTPKTGGPDVRPPGDWTCSKCGVHNFKRRDHCFKCSISKDESDRSKEGEGYEQVGHNLCNTVILRGLDALTREENIVTAIHKTAPVVQKNIRIIRDPLTQASKGHAFCEMGSIGDSCKLIDAISKLNGPFEVDGKAIIVNYAKNTFSTVMATMNQQWAAQQFAAAASGQAVDPAQYTAAAAAAAAAAAGAGASQQTAQGYYDAAGNFHYYDYSQYYAQQQQQQAAQAATAGYSATDPDGNQSDTTNAAAAVAQAAIQAAQAAKAMQKKASALQPRAVIEPKPADYQYPVPDVSTYQYDETSGYYYDPTTGLYYDANTQYYYNSQTGQFLYWDGEKKTYLPSPGDAATPADQQQAEGGEKSEKKDKDKKEKVKVAKKIAKDMEKWAKSMNAAKESQKDGTFGRVASTSQVVERKETAAADAGFAILEKVKKDPNWKSPDVGLMPPPPALSGGKTSPSSGLVPDYDDAEDSEEEADDGMDDDKFSDWSKMACLLCKRQFPNKDGLTRHNQLSDLHKSNLEEHKKKKAASQGSLTAFGKLQYRDRAKERRAKYGTAAPPEPRKGGNAAAKAPVPFEQPTKQGIGEDNIGNKLMKKMGWNSGEGLGRGKTGIRDPIRAQRRQMGVGLGAGSSAIQLEPGDTYKDCVKKTMMARFAEMNS